MDALTLARCTGSTVARAAPYAEALTQQMQRFNIDGPMRQSHLLANVAVETLYLNAVEEGLYYTTPGRLREIFPSLFVPARGGRYVAEEYTRNPAGLSRIKYAGYHGRGLLHLTWHEAYVAAGEALGFDYAGNPALVMQPWHAAATACWFFGAYKRLNGAADMGNMDAVREGINGKAKLELDKCRTLQRAALRVLGG